MKKFKIILAGMLIFTAIFSISVPAFADLVRVPYEDKFFNEHEDKCEQLMFKYSVNSENGYIYVYNSPESDMQIGYFINDQIIYVGYTYIDLEGRNGVYVTVSPDGFL